MTATIVNGVTNSQTATFSGTPLDNLPTGSVAISDTIDNSTNRFSAGTVQVKIKTGTGTSPNGTVCVMLLKSSDGGVTFDDADESNATVLITFNANQNATSYTVSADSARNCGHLAEFLRFAILNETGANFDTNPANFSVRYLGKRITTF